MQPEALLYTVNVLHSTLFADECISENRIIDRAYNDSGFYRYTTNPV